MNDNAAAARVVLVLVLVSPGSPTVLIDECPEHG